MYSIVLFIISLVVVGGNMHYVGERTSGSIFHNRTTKRCGQTKGRAKKQYCRAPFFPMTDGHMQLKLGVLRKIRAIKVLKFITKV